MADSTANPRRYYSDRTGSQNFTPIDLKTLKGLFLNVWTHFHNNGYFDQNFGSWYIDQGVIPGSIGSNIDDYVVLTLRRLNLWPINNNIEEWVETDLFDMIEFLHDHISKPTNGTLHDYGGCGYHWTEFDIDSGKREFKDKINIILQAYGEGYEISDKGEIMVIGPLALSKLLNATLPTKDVTVAERVQRAITLFQRYGSNIADRHDAVIELARVLEWLRPKIKTALMKEDENHLFNLANNFGIRHLNQRQKLEYDKAVWLSWMFYYYLATINACLHIIKRQGSEIS